MNKEHTPNIESERVSGAMMDGYSPDAIYSKPPSPSPESDAAAAAAGDYLTIAVKRVGGQQGGDDDDPYVTLDGVRPETTVSELKRAIHRARAMVDAQNMKVAAAAVSASHQPIPAERQRLIFAGRMLTEDSERLGEGVKMEPGGTVNFVHLVPIPEGKKLSSRNRNENKSGRTMRSSTTTAPSVNSSRRRIPLRGEGGSNAAQRRRARRDAAAAPYPSPYRMAAGRAAANSRPSAVPSSSSFVAPRLMGGATAPAPAPTARSARVGPTTAAAYAFAGAAGTTVAETQQRQRQQPSFAALSRDDGQRRESSANASSFANLSTASTVNGYLSNHTLLELSRAQQDAASISELLGGGLVAVAAPPALGLGIATRQQPPISLAEAILQATQRTAAPGPTVTNSCSVGVMDNLALLSREATPLHECLAPALRIVNEILQNEAHRHDQLRSIAGFVPSPPSSSSPFLVPSLVGPPPGQSAQISSALVEVAELLDQSARQSEQLALLLRSVTSVGASASASPGQQVQYLGGFTDNYNYSRQSAAGFEAGVIPPAAMSAATASLPPAGLFAAAAAGVPAALSGSLSDLLAVPPPGGSCDGGTMDFLSSIDSLL